LDISNVVGTKSSLVIIELEAVVGSDECIILFRTNGTDFEFQSGNSSSGGQHSISQGYIWDTYHPNSLIMVTTDVNGFLEFRKQHYHHNPELKMNVVFYLNQ